MASRNNGREDIPPTVLVPLDGSPLAERVLPYAARLARPRPARLLLLRVIMATAPASEAAASLATLARVWRATGIAVETRCASLRAYGNDLVAEAILAVANTQGADLIAMSTHGRSGLGRLLYGSVAAHVLRYAETPVLLVPATVGRLWPEDRPLRLLVPLDGSRDAESILGAVRETLADIPVEMVVARVLDDAGAYLHAAASPLPVGASSVGTETAVGEPAAAVLGLARDRQVDLIAMTAHAFNAGRPDAPGPTVQRLLHRTEVPLLLIRGGE
jgi:nucleotide-binding universal stress UspA family protein